MVFTPQNVASCKKRYTKDIAQKAYHCEVFVSLEPLVPRKSPYVRISKSIRIDDLPSSCPHTSAFFGKIKVVFSPSSHSLVLLKYSPAISGAQTNV